MATSKNRLKKAASIQVPQTRNEVAADIRHIGDLTRTVEKLMAAMNDEIAAVTHKYQGDIDAAKADIDVYSHGVQVWCEANRDKLTNGGKVKTANLVTGNVMWRNRPPSAAIRGADSVIKVLRAHGLERFIRVKEEVNKEAILNEPEAVRGIAGIRINTGTEDFVIEPFAQEVP